MSAQIENDSTAASAQLQSEMDASKDAKSMDYHRQMLQAKLAQGGEDHTYVSPSDNIMSPCTAKLSGLKSKHAMKVKPRSLFAKTQSKNIERSGGSMFADKPAEPKAADAGMS